MKRLLFILLALSVIGCKDPEPVSPGKDYTGIIITEVAANADKIATDSWVELCNVSSKDIDLTGLGIFLFDQNSDGEELTIMDGIIARAGERMVFTTADMSLIRGISSDSSFEIVLGTSGGKTVVDEFSRDKDGSASKTVRYGSYQRIPEDGDEWKITAQATRRVRNYDALPNGIWVWSTHIDDWMEGDFQLLKDMKKKGYHHILLNYNAFDDEAKAVMTRQLIAAAKENDVKIHAWMQTFREGTTWVNPIENLGGGQGRYKQEEFDRIIAKAARYIDEFDVDGIHLDYVRFSGVGANAAYANNYSNGVTAGGAINEFCRQLREYIDSRLEGVMVSAAMMTGNTLYYYGQEPSQMGKYIDVLMPMSYKYYSNKNNDNSWLRGTLRTFLEATTTQIWAGIQSYTHVPGSEDVIGMTPEQMLADMEVVRSTKCTGLVMFRHKLGEYPDISDIWE